MIKGDYDIYGNTYVFSNGEKSVVLMESLKNDSTSWWKNHLKWSLPKRTVLPLAQRTKEFERFVNALMEQGIGTEMQIATDSSNVNIRLVVDADSGYQLPNQRKMQRDAWQLINCFDVFAEHAAAKSDFCINIADKSGNDLGSLVLPYMQYAQMEDEPCLTYDEEY